jgi:hypothetical protein
MSAAAPAPAAVDAFPAPDGTGHLALNVYVWGEREQDRVMTEALGPALAALRDDGALRRLWLHRFDVRGPHLMAVLGGPLHRSGEVRARLAAALDAYLADAPSPVVLDADTLRRRHDDCRGRALNPVDAREGFAPNNSYAFGAQDPAEAYVFRRAEGMDTAALEPLLADLALWSVARLRAGSGAGTAVAWMAGLTGALRGAGLEPEGFWRYYASTLLLRGTERILAAHPEVVAGLPNLIGAPNLATLGGAWNAAEAAPPAWPGAPALAAVVAASSASDEARHVFVRELCHGVFAQLNQLVRIRIPLVLYAWHRTLLQTAPQ